MWFYYVDLSAELNLLTTGVGKIESLDAIFIELWSARNNC